MNNYYFTFGQEHTNSHGLPLKDYWVRVVAENMSVARQLFVKYFAEPYLPYPTQFSFQYDELHFVNKSWFLKGELTVVAYPAQGGCWICYLKDKDLNFSVDFDSTVHRRCLKKHGVKDIHEYEEKQG